MKVSSLSKKERQSIIKSKLIDQETIISDKTITKALNDTKGQYQRLNFLIQLCTNLPFTLEINRFDDLIPKLKIYKYAQEIDTNKVKNTTVKIDINKNFKPRFDLNDEFMNSCNFQQYQIDKMEIYYSIPYM